MQRQVNLGIIFLCITITIVDRTVLISGQQEEKFFYHSDFTHSGDQNHQQVAGTNGKLPVFPEGPLHVSLGLRALSGDNRPQFSESIGSIQAQEWQMTTPNPLEGPQETLMPGRQMPGKRQRRPGRRRKKRPTTTENSPSPAEEDSYQESTLRPSSGEPTFDYRVSGEERDSPVRVKKPTMPLQGGLSAQLSNYKQNRRPYSIRKDSDSESTNADTRSDLKSLLKSAGGSLSLSEVLQQKNISLADLLNKKQHALAALTKSSDGATTPRMDLNSGEMMMTGEDEPEVKKHRRVPMFVAMPPHVYPTEELRPPLPQSPTIAADTVIVNRRIPGPTVHSKPIKEVVSRIRPDFSNSKRTSTENNNSTTTIRPRWKAPMEGRMRNRPELNRNPMPTYIPSSQQPELVTTDRRNFQNTERPSGIQTTGLPPNYLSSPASTIVFENLKNYRNRESFKEEAAASGERLNNVIERESDKANRDVATIEDLFKYNPRTDGDRSKNRIEADLIERVIQNTQRALIESSRNGAMKVDVTERNPGLFMDITSEKAVDDKTDLLELLTDRRNGAKLSKLLEQRNMTLDELVEHRRRGSSQLHLLEILNNRLMGDRQGKAKGASGLDVVTAFDNFPQFSFANLRSVRPDEVKTDSQGASYFASVFNVRPTEDRPRFRNRNPFDQLGRGSHGMSAPQSRVAGTRDEANFVDPADYEPMNMKPVDVEPTQLPVGVRSAIIASTSIVVVCVMIFILIFVVFRYRQRKMRKLQYVESFRGARARFPIIDRDCTSKRSTSPMVYQTTLTSGTNSSRLSSKLHSLDSHPSLDLPDYLFESMKSY